MSLPSKVASHHLDSMTWWELHLELWQQGEVAHKRYLELMQKEHAKLLEQLNSQSDEPKPATLSKEEIVIWLIRMQFWQIGPLCGLITEKDPWKHRHEYSLSSDKPEGE